VGFVAEKSSSKIELEHYKVNGRSEYEAIGYAFMKRMFHEGKIIYTVNAVRCDGESGCGDNSDSILNAD
jgi:hypothetical protein